MIFFFFENGYYIYIKIGLLLTWFTGKFRWKKRGVIPNKNLNLLLNYHYLGYTAPQGYIAAWILSNSWLLLSELMMWSKAAKSRRHQKINLPRNWYFFKLYNYTYFNFLLHLKPIYESHSSNKSTRSYEWGKKSCLTWKKKE